MIYVSERWKWPGCRDVICEPSLLRQSVDKLCAAVDELRAYFAGHFVLACRITKGGGGGRSADLERKPPSPDRSMKAAYRRKQMAMR